MARVAAERRDYEQLCWQAALEAKRTCHTMVVYRRELGAFSTYVTSTLEALLALDVGVFGTLTDIWLAWPDMTIHRFKATETNHGG